MHNYDQLRAVAQLTDTKQVEAEHIGNEVTAFGVGDQFFGDNQLMLCGARGAKISTCISRLGW